VPFKEFLFVVAFLAAWIVLNRWVLPWFGVATCMSGACAVDPRRAAVDRGAAAAESECSCASCGVVLDDGEDPAETRQDQEAASEKGNGT
jgi:hypothetical protein